jgi:hypothetical protein
MELGNDILCAKVITFTGANLAKIEPPQLSEEIRQIIVESGVKSLQDLVGSDARTAVRNVMRNYWSLK